MNKLLPFAVFCFLLFISACKKDDNDKDNQAGASDYYITDIYENVNRPGFVLLNLKAYQQTTDYTCGPASALTLLHYYHRDGNEMSIASEMHTSASTGTTPENLATWLGNNGFNVNWGENGTLEMIRQNLANNIPTLVEWSDWGGHWVLAVGYDTRNTEDPMDDVIIFADPYDRHDDLVDGINWFNAQRFYYMWYDALLFDRVMRRVYITATPESN